MIRHHAFFEALGAIDDEKSTEWKSVFAGLSVLRLLDRLVELRESSQQPGIHEFDSPQRAVEAVSEGDPARAILLRILERPSIETETGRDLISYGRALDLAAKWSLAVDVFETAAEMFSPRRDAAIVIEASTLLAAAARNTGDWQKSERAYTRAEHLAESTGDKAGSLTAKIGLANSEMFHGNLQSADESLGRIVAEANALQLEKVEATALHDRATVAHLKGEYERGIHLAYRSLELTPNQTARERLLADIAAGYGELGMREAARHGYSIVAITSPHQWVRWQSMLNLLGLAIDEGDEASFDNYVRELDTAAFDPRLKTYFLFHKARGARAFNKGNSDSLFKEAQAFAEQNKLHQLAFEIEAAASKPAPDITFEPTPELTRIAEVLEHLHDEISAKEP